MDSGQAAEIMAGLMQLEQEAYGWNIGGEVCGLKVADFEHLMLSAAGCIERLTAELSTVKRECDAAVDDIGQIMRACPTDYRPCDWCADYPNGVCYNRTTYAGCTACEPVWRGLCAGERAGGE